MHHTDALGDVDEVVMRLMTEVNTNAACSAPGGAVVVRVEERNRSLGPRGPLFHSHQETACKILRGDRVTGDTSEQD